MTDKKKEVWQLGEGSYVLNEDAPVDTLLGDASEWLASAWYLADEVAHRAAMGKAINAEELREKLGTVRMLTRMGVQCVRIVRRKVLWDTQHHIEETSAT